MEHGGVGEPDEDFPSDDFAEAEPMPKTRAIKVIVERQIKFGLTPHCPGCHHNARLHTPECHERFRVLVEEDRIKQEADKLARAEARAKAAATAPSSSSTDPLPAPSPALVATEAAMAAPVINKSIFCTECLEGAYCCVCAPVPESRVEFTNR